MTEFEFLVSLYGLVLGLAFANVATGFADVWRTRKDLALGWCTPLLAVYLTVASTGTWLNMWEARDDMEVDAVRVLLSLASFLPMVFLSRAIFPQPNEGWSSLEDYYLAHRQVIVGAVILTRLVGMVTLLVVGDWPGWITIAYIAARLILLTAMLFIGSVWFHRIGWALISLGVVWMLIL